MFSSEGVRVVRSVRPGQIANRRRPSLLAAVFIAFGLVANACSIGNDGADVVESVTELETGPCSGGFIASSLDHITTTLNSTPTQADATGTGVSAEDLDGDGDIDIVFPNLRGELSVFWNDGSGRFDRTGVTDGRFRQALVADATGDGRRDLIMVTGVGPPVVLTQPDDAADTEWASEVLDRTAVVGYSGAVGDTSGDGSLDLVTSSYNAELTAARDPRVLRGEDTGIIRYELEPGLVVANGAADDPGELLTEQSQGLVTTIADLDNDGRQDIYVGNDLGTPDRVWINTESGFELVSPFTQSSLSTMGMDLGDVNNDGLMDLYTTDMAPLAGEDPALWEPINADIEAATTDEIQKPRNVLQLGTGVAFDRGFGQGFDEQGRELGVHATGWSWSALLGDLDNDGLTDVFVVNGMNAVGLFDPPFGPELVEPNQVFRNIAGGFEPRTDWGLNDTAGGRGAALGDFDGDGDLDVVVNNLNAPSMLFDNQLCTGRSIIVEPTWEGVANLDALGALVTLSYGESTRIQQMTSTRGYLSTSATQAHFGIGEWSGDATVTVRWPDGIETSHDVNDNQRLDLRRTSPPVVTE